MWLLAAAGLPVGSVGQGHFREVEGSLDGGFAGFAEELDVFLVEREDGVAGSGFLCKIENDGGDGARVFGLAAGDALNGRVRGWDFGLFLWLERSFCGEVFFLGSEEWSHILANDGNGELGGFVSQGFGGIGFRHGTAEDLRARESLADGARRKPADCEGGFRRIGGVYDGLVLREGSRVGVGRSAGHAA